MLTMRKTIIVPLFLISLFGSVAQEARSQEHNLAKSSGTILTAKMQLSEMSKFCTKEFPNKSEHYEEQLKNWENRQKSIIDVAVEKFERLAATNRAAADNYEKNTRAVIIKNINTFYSTNPTLACKQHSTKMSSGAMDLYKTNPNDVATIELYLKQPEIFR